MEKKEQDFILFQKVLRERIRKLRTDRGWTLEETEEHGWKSWRHLQRIESGQNFTIYTLWKICKLYGIKMADIFKKL
ncbi:MAG: helix-turn-helix domain-containing protein [Deltaproteobacteria bacterium]